MVRFAGIPYVGRQSYSLTQCMKMALDARGDSYALEYLECVSAHPFGFLYQREGEHGGCASLGFDYEVAAERLLRLLGYTHVVRSFASPEAAVTGLRFALAEGPVVVGALDATLLPYHSAPTARPTARPTATPHAVVVLGQDDECVFVHDPEGYVSMPVPLDDFVRAWRAEALPHSQARPFTLWQIGPRGTVPDPLIVALQALDLALANTQRPHEALTPGQTLLYGPDAIRMLARDIASTTADEWLNLYPTITWPAAAQRCADRATFLLHVPCANDRLRRAATLSQRQAVLYGFAQLANRQGDRARLATTLLDIADAEQQFALALEDGVRLARHRNEPFLTRAQVPLLAARAS